MFTLSDFEWNPKNTQNPTSSIHLLRCGGARVIPHPQVNTFLTFQSILTHICVHPTCVRTHQDHPTPFLKQCCVCAHTEHPVVFIFSIIHTPNTQLHAHIKRNIVTYAECS